MTEWQPIETAPRDGTVIWCYEKYGLGWPHAIKFASYDEWQGWIYADEMMCDYVPEPTHWMPLPAPPASE